MYFTLSLERKRGRRVREATEGNGKREIISNVWSGPGMVKYG
jgi:hypothetical protein